MPEMIKLHTRTWSSKCLPIDPRKLPSSIPASSEVDRQLPISCQIVVQQFFLEPSCPTFGHVLPNRVICFQCWPAWDSWPNVTNLADNIHLPIFAQIRPHRLKLVELGLRVLPTSAHRWEAPQLDPARVPLIWAEYRLPEQCSREYIVEQPCRKMSCVRQTARLSGAGSGGGSQPPSNFLTRPLCPSPSPLSPPCCPHFIHSFAPPHLSSPPLRPSPLLQFQTRPLFLCPVVAMQLAFPWCGHQETSNV